MKKLSANKPKYDFAFSFNHGLAEVQIGTSDLYSEDTTLHGYINKKGSFIWKPSR